MTVTLNAFADQLPVDVFSARCLSFKLTTAPSHPGLSASEMPCPTNSACADLLRTTPAKVSRQFAQRPNVSRGQTNTSLHVYHFTRRLAPSGTTREATRGGGRLGIIGRHSRATGVDGARAVVTSTMPHTTLTKCSFIQWFDQISINVVRFSPLRFISVVYNRTTTTTWATAHRVCASVSNTAMCVTTPQLFYHQ